jgi:hypothetical protein
MFLILITIERDLIKSVDDLRVKYPLFLSHFNKTLIFLTDFRNTVNDQVSWKSFRWEPSFSMRTEGRTDRRDEAKSYFLDGFNNLFANGCLVD